MSPRFLWSATFLKVPRSELQARMARNDYLVTLNQFSVENHFGNQVCPEYGHALLGFRIWEGSARYEWCKVRDEMFPPAFRFASCWAKFNRRFATYAQGRWSLRTAKRSNVHRLESLCHMSQSQADKPVPQRRPCFNRRLKPTLQTFQRLLPSIPLRFMLG
jgi:hypothetical protein